MIEEIQIKLLSLCFKRAQESVYFIFSASLVKQTSVENF